MKIGNMGFWKYNKSYTLLNLVIRRIRQRPAEQIHFLKEMLFITRQAAGNVRLVRQNSFVVESHVIVRPSHMSTFVRENQFWKIKHFCDFLKTISQPEDGISKP